MATTLTVNAPPVDFGPDDAACGNKLRRAIVDEMCHGLNLSVVLAELHAVDPETFANIATVFNRAANARAAG